METLCSVTDTTLGVCLGVSGYVPPPPIDRIPVLHQIKIWGGGGGGGDIYKC